MVQPLAITYTSHTSAELHRMATTCNCVRMARRLRVIAMVIAGDMTRTAIAGSHGTTAQSVRDWVIRYNEGGPDNLADRVRSGRPPLVDKTQGEEVARWVDNGPDKDKDGVSRWRVFDLKAKLRSALGIAMGREAMRLLLHRLGYSHQSPRPVHRKADAAKQAEFRQKFTQKLLEAVPEGVLRENIMVFFQDEARAGQKGMLSRVWTKRGKRPRIVKDHRYGYGYMFVAGCGQTGTLAGHVCERANTDEMNRHLTGISAAIPCRHHAVIILDGAGWHRSKALDVPGNVTLLRLPPYSPELNAMENMFNYGKSNYLSNQVFESRDDVRKALQDSLQKMRDDVERIKSILSPRWARLEPEQNGTPIPAES